MIPPISEETAAEMVVAALGLEPILRGQPSWSLERERDAVMFPKRARAALLKALAVQDPDGSADEPDFDYDEAVKLLEAGDEQVQARTQALFDALPDDIQDGAEAAATRAISYLQGILPRRVTKTTANVIVSPPEPFELDRFARAWRVAMDPMSALDAMAEGALDMVMVGALEAAYPAIYELVAGEGGLLDDAIATMRARRGDKWDVTDDQDRQVKILIGADPIDLDLTKDYASVQPVTPAPAAKPAAQGVRPMDELLPSQKQA